MPDRVPSYRRHSSGQARVTLRDSVTKSARDVLLGPFGSDESRREYARVLSEWEAAKRRLTDRVAGPDFTMNELMLAFLKDIEGRYAGKSEGIEFRSAFRPLKDMYGHLPVSGFGPLKLKAARERMVAEGATRKTVNARVWRIKFVFAWAVENELVAAPVWQALLAVKGLRAGKTPAPETEPVRPVPELHVDETLPYLAPTVRAMVQLQRLTGMRPGEVCAMRACDIDRSGDVWVYRPPTHKNAWRGKERVIAIGPKGQEVLEPILAAASDGAARLFRPDVAMRERQAIKRARRKSPVQPSQIDRSIEKPVRPPGTEWSVQAYGRAIGYAVLRANAARREKDPAAEPMPKWSPNQLRHLHATLVRKLFGLEAAQVALGHASADMTQVYAERNLDLAAKVAREIG